ncbi:MAG: phosphatase [Oscillospiraceae bacterium]
MKCALIDIGSNSMRLSVYDVNKDSFKTLFHEKDMAGLAGFVDKKHLTPEGIARACDGLIQFRETLDQLDIDKVSVFATASLRNIENTGEAVAEITRRTGFSIEVVSGHDEAFFGYTGAMYELGMRDGVFVDIGGASTEIVTFKNSGMLSAESIPIGSLRLYADYVKKILPRRSGLVRIEERVRQELTAVPNDSCSCIAGVGGTTRAALKLVKKKFSLAADCREMSAEQLNGLWDTLIKTDKTAINLILKTEPERIHTIIPGIAILREIVNKFSVQKIVISNYGVREGYLCHRIQKEIPATRKTVS